MKELLGKKYTLLVDNREGTENFIDAVVELDDFDDESLILKSDKYSVVLKSKYNIDGLAQSS